MIINFVHRIYNSTNTWQYFHQGLNEAKELLIKNQYPPEIFDKIIHQTLEKIFLKTDKKPPDKDEIEDAKMAFIEYSRSITD